VWPRTTGCLPIKSDVNNSSSTPYPDFSIQHPDPKSEGDPHHFYPAFHFDADPDPTFRSDANPEPDPTFQFDADPQHWPKQ
jgi:hypothetical protein